MSRDEAWVTKFNASPLNKKLQMLMVNYCSRNEDRRAIEQVDPMTREGAAELRRLGETIAQHATPHAAERFRRYASELDS